MGKTRAAYPPEFRRQMVELVRAGRSPEELAREFEPTAPSIRYFSRTFGACSPPIESFTRRLSSTDGSPFSASGKNRPLPNPSL